MGNHSKWYNRLGFELATFWSLVQPLNHYTAGTIVWIQGKVTVMTLDNLSLYLYRRCPVNMKWAEYDYYDRWVRTWPSLIDYQASTSQVPAVYSPESTWAEWMWWGSPVYGLDTRSADHQVTMVDMFMFLPRYDWLNMDFCIQVTGNNGGEERDTFPTCQNLTTWHVSRNINMWMWYTQWCDCRFKPGTHWTNNFIVYKSDPIF